MSDNRIFFDKDATNIIKGIALIFMFIHHFFTFPEWYVEGISYPNLIGFAHFFQNPFKICVPVFAFLTGYFYFFSKNKTFSYSLKKCSDLWINYFITFLILLVPVIITNTYNFDILIFFAESFALKRPTMVFCWYVIFYITSMLVLPLYSKLSKKNTVLPFFACIIIPIVFEPYANKIPIVDQIVSNFLWFPSVAIGYIFAQHNIFSSIEEAVKSKHTIVNVLVSFCFLFFPFLARYYTTNYDFILAPLFIYGLITLVKLINKKILTPISLIGKYSLSMWFIHCVFFNISKEYTQWLLYLPKNPLLVLIWGLTICLLISVIIMLPINFVIKIKNKLFKWD